MAGELIAYEWECPICSQKKMSLTAQDRTALAGLAKNSLLSHVRVTDGGGHGNMQEYPPGFNPDIALEYIQFIDDMNDESLRDDATLIP